MGSGKNKMKKETIKVNITVLNKEVRTTFSPAEDAFIAYASLCEDCANIARGVYKKRKAGTSCRVCRAK